MYKLKFTDNSFISILDEDDFIEKSAPLSITYALPNFIFYPWGSYNIAKTDLAGNTYEFTSNGTTVTFTFNGTIKVNGANYYYLGIQGDNLICTTYNKGANLNQAKYYTYNGYIAGICIDGTGTTTRPYLNTMLQDISNIGDGKYGSVINVITSGTIGKSSIEFYSDSKSNSNYTIDHYISDCINYGSGTATGGQPVLTTKALVNSALEYFDPTPDTDPYADAGNSDTGGGDGTFDGTSDPVPIPSLPSVGATDSGFITLFAPTMTQLKALAHYMWTNPLFDVETGFKKLFSDPMDCILGLSVVPVAVPTSGAQNVNIGNLVTSVTMNVASQQYIEIDCGSISFANKFFGSYLDYEPYTKMAIFVPYSGVHSLSADDIMGKTVQLVYHIDILTGSLVAFLKCGDSVLYEFNGACGSNIPVNSLNYASTIENAIRIAVNIGTTVATAGAAAPAAMGAEAVGGAMTARNIATGINLAGSTAEGALSLKPNIDRAGSLGGTTGLLGNQIPYIIITRPRLCKPKYQNKIKGYPSFITCTLGDLDGKGYTEIDTVILNNIYLTDAEKDDLIGVLKGGVYL